MLQTSQNIPCIARISSPPHDRKITNYYNDGCNANYYDGNFDDNDDKSSQITYIKGFGYNFTNFRDYIIHGKKDPKNSPKENIFVLGGLPIVLKPDWMLLGLSMWNQI